MTSDRQDEADDIANGRVELVRSLVGVANAEVTALRDVYNLTSSKLFGICLRICGDRSGAEDVMQDVLIKVWTSAATFDPARSSPITWLCTIARNTSIDWLRARNRVPISRSDAGWDIADRRSGTEQDLLDRERNGRLHTCLDRLEDRQRACIQAAFFDGMTYADLAKQMDTPLNTVKTWVRRGFQSLRACLSDD